MKITRCSIAIASLLMASLVSAADNPFPPFFGTVPADSVKSWIKLFVLGPRNAPFPIVIISTKRFKSVGYRESLIVLPRTRYNIVSKFTEARITDCEAPPSKPLPWYTLALQQHARRQTSLCILSQKTACDYLSDVLKLPEINWSAEEIKPINDLAISIKCSGPTYSDGRPYP